MGKRSEATSDRYHKKNKSRDPSYQRVFGNYPAKKYKKGTPAITRLSFEFTGPGTRYLDVAGALSALNRKAFRQGCYYYINSVEFYDNANSMVDLHVLPDNWITRSSYRRAKGIFDSMNEKVAKSGASLIYPKYHDFKVYMCDRHVTEGTTMPSLYEINGSQRVIAPDEWAYSKITSADDDQDNTVDADEFHVHMLGAHNGSTSNWVSIGAIKSYSDTRPMVTDTQPEFISDAAVEADPLLNILDYSSEEQLNDIIDNLNDDNDSPPYDRDVYVGRGGAGINVNGQIVGDVPDMMHVVRLNTTAETGRVDRQGGFCAPLGLICVDPDNNMSGGNKFRVVLNLAVGTYHGVYAERVA